MNRHWAEGALQALLDDELSPAQRASAEAHLAGCAECAGQLRELRALHARGAELLALADVPAPVAQAQMALRSRRRPWVMLPGRALPGALLRAAVLVLGLAGLAGIAMAAVPGTPVHRYLLSHHLLPAPREAVQPALRPAAPPAPVAATPAAPAPTGVSIRPDEGAVRVVLIGAAPRLRITARLVPGERAGVLARGNAVSGARFRTSPGRIEVTGVGPGEVEIELPRAAPVATVEVNGRIYVAREGDALRVIAPAAGARGAPDVRVGG